MIAYLSVKNFRSFREVAVELRPLNVVVGANASGKSNFVQIFRFLRDLANHDLENAIALQGGVGRVSNIKSDTKITEIAIQFTSQRFRVRKSPKASEKFHQFHYIIQVGYNRKKAPLILSESLKIQLVKEDGASPEWIEIKREQDKISVPEEMASGFWRGIERSEISIPETVSLLRTPFTPFPLFDRSIVIYDFQPKLAKQAVPVAGPADLEEDGRNLPLVLQRLLKSSEARDRLLLLVQYFIPFIKSLDVQSLPNSSIMLSVQESYLGKHQLPASLLSDGSVEIIALIVARHFSSPFAETLVFEEPDRNLHPALMTKLMEMFRNTNDNRQVILTTHNPELVQCTPIDDLFLIERDSEGFSIIKRPSEQTMVQEFLKEELGLGTLHTQHLLGV